MEVLVEAPGGEGALQEMEDGEVTDDGELSDVSDDGSLEEGEVLSQPLEEEEEESCRYDRARYYGGREEQGSRREVRGSKGEELGSRREERGSRREERGSRREEKGSRREVRASKIEEQGWRREEVSESPASPEGAADTWSCLPVTEIPVEGLLCLPEPCPSLPPGVRERGGWVQVRGPEPELEEQEEPVEQEEDLDEDILYLRLIALRSLANEREEEERREKEGRLEGGVDTAEMLELLEEAEAASGDSAAAATEVITIDDDDEDPISSLKLHLNETYISTGFQRSFELVEVTDSPSYSPTQTPEPLSPLYLPSDLTISPPDSPNDCMVVEPSPPPLPPLPLAPPPPCPPPPSYTYPSPVPCTEEPLPPGEEFRAVTPPPRHAHLPPQQPLDMDLDSGDEAEVEFFRSQRSVEDYPGSTIFPPSVWDFGGGGERGGREARQGRDENDGRKRREREGRREDSRTKQSKRRKRKSSSRDKENLRKKEVKEEKDTPSLEEDEESLRAILLAQVSKAQTKKLSPAISPREDKMKEANIPPPPPAEPSLASSPLPPALSTPPPPPAPSTPPVPAESSRRTQPTAPGQRSLPKSRTLARRTSKTKLVPGLSKADQLKHFPNLSRKIIIPCIGAGSSDSEDEELGTNGPVLESPKINGSSSAVFGLNLEAFLKEARNTAAPALPSQDKKLLKQKLTLTPKLKAQALKLTLADKKRLISSKISHLSRSKQIEYQRLKEILAKKEAAKRKATPGDPRPAPAARLATPVDPRLAPAPTLVDPRPAPAPTQGDPRPAPAPRLAAPEEPPAADPPAAAGKAEAAEDEETALRKKLIANMKASSQKKEALSKVKEAVPQRTVVMNSSSSAEKKEDVTAKGIDNEAVGESVDNRKGEMTVVITGDNLDRNVEVKEAVKKAEVKEAVKKADVKEAVTKATSSEHVRKEKLEGRVVSGRKILSTSLFKLSAFMSQLQKETIGVESGLQYAEELRRQLRETEDLVRLRERNVEKLRESIKHQHEQIIAEREVMVGMEETCRAAGIAVPEEGAENIQKKLAQIKNTAMKVKTTNYETRDQEVKKEESPAKSAALAGKSSPKPSSNKTEKTPGMSPVKTNISKAKPDVKEVAKKTDAADDVSCRLAAGQVGGGVGGVAGAGDYISPLAAMQQGGQVLDPHRPLCRFQLSGKCLDAGCQDQHTD